MLLLVCSVGVAQESRSVRLRVEPADAKLEVVKFGDVTRAPQQTRRSDDGEVTIPAEAFDRDYNFHYRFSHPDYKFGDDWKRARLKVLDESTPDPNDETFLREFPAGDAVRGEPKSAWAALKHAPLAVRAILVVLLLGGAGWGGSLFVSSRRLRKRQEAQEALERKRQSLIAHADMSDPLINTTLGKYLIVDTLGHGGMAIVYKGVPADTLDSKDQVAIKVILKQFAEKEEFRERFKREVRVSKGLNHPNIVRVNDWGDQDGLLYLALEFVDGKTMDDMLPENGWSVEEGLPYLLPIISGLVYAHERDIIHRDLKPENVMVTQKGLVKIMDYGLARTITLSSKVTATGSAMGTPAYMSPEQILANVPPGPSMDQYSLGIMMYEMFTGRPPFKNDSNDEGPMAIVMKQLQEVPCSPAEFKPSLNPALCQIILRMLKKDPAMRFESLAVVKEGLEHVLAHGTWELPAPPQPKEPSPEESTRFEAPNSQAPVDNEGTLGFQAPSNDEGTLGFQAPSNDEDTVGFRAPSDDEGTVGFQSPEP
jgi:serine/threonine protein kinase